jgi:T5SS/PEP-CTERM-associated repeat protein
MTPRHPHIRRRPTLTAAALLALAGAASAQPSTLPFPAVFELADLLPVNGGDGSLGFVINGIEQYDISGRSLSSAGDVNGDGFDDLIIGAQAADANGQLMAGQSYVVFGGPGVGASGSLELASLNGLNGFVINGFDTDDRSGYSVASAGDVNGDGVDDVVIGADLAEPNGQFRAGECYVVFGGPTVGAGGSVELASLDGTDGFVLSGLDANDVVGLAISSAGDVNGDGVGDLIIGAAGGDPNGQSAAGESYLVFGGPSVGAGGSLDLASLNGINGFVINGIDVDDQSGRSVASAGDVNGDGADDVIIGATVAGPNGQSRAGESYVIFGAPGVGAGGTLDLSSLDGTDGFVLNGIDAYDQSGFPVASAGDVNGDGVDDVIIGARSADPNGLGNAGESYIVFGGPSVGAGGSLDLASLDGTNGLVLNGIDEQDLSGGSVASAGDVNGDGIDDVIIGARSADPNGQAYAGETYVVFGRPGIGAGGSLELSSLDGTNGFVLNGIDGYDISGHAVSSAGDVNGDGVDDVIIGAWQADPNGQNSAGESYIVFGRLTNARIWTNPNGGNLALPANWQDGLAPGPGDTAAIDNVLAGTTAGVFSIILPAPQSIRSLLARSDDVTLNLNGHTLALGDGAFPTGGGLTVGGRATEEARLRLINSQLLQTFATADDVVVGPNLTSASINPLARLTIEGGAAGLDIARRLIVGDQASDAQCWVLAGAEVAVGGELLLALEAPSGAQLRIDQAGSELTLDAPAERILVGRRGDASVEITSGGGLETTTILESTTLAEGPLASATVTIDGPGSRWISAQQDFVIGGAGNATLTISDDAQLRTDTTNQLVIARDPGSSSEIVIDGAASSWTELTQSIAVGGEGSATVRLINGASLASFVGINVRSLGTIVGDGTINAPTVTTSGAIAPGDDTAPGALQINGSLRQVGVPPGGGSADAGAIDLDLFGSNPGEFDSVNVTGDLELAGRLRITFAPGFTPSPSALDNLQLITAGSNFEASAFDVALMPNIGTGDFLSVAYGSTARGADARAAVTVSLTVNPLTGDIDLDPNAAADSNAAGVPTGATLADLDLDGDPDLLIALPDANNPTTAPGSVVVLYNDDDGNPANGWEGFGQTLQISAGVGVNPSAVAVGLLDGDAQPDIAVANRGDDTVSLLLVTDPSPGSFATVGGIAPVPVGDEPADVIIADLDQDGLNDIATANAGDHTITFAPNEGPAIGPSWERVDPVPIGLPEDGECPLSIRPGDTDAMLTSRFVATANAGNGSIGLVQINPDRTFVVLPNLPTDANPRELIVADLDGDGLDDIATVNAEDLEDGTGSTSLSVALNESVGGVLAVGPTSDLPIDATTQLTRSITSGDYDDDEDTDLAVLADGVVKVLRNDLFVVEETAERRLAFTPIADQPAGTAPLLVRSGDLNADGQDDVVTVAESTGGGGARSGGRATDESINTLLASVPAPACVADITGDGVTDVFDFSDLAAAFGATPADPNWDPGADLNDDDVVDVFDFSDLAADFGCVGD